MTVFTKPIITAAAARRMIEAAVARADALGTRSVVAVVDDSGHLTALCRMDGAPVVSIGVAQNKAYTALLGLPSDEFYRTVKHDPAVLAGILHTPRISAFGGGLPIWVDGALVGAVGVGGGTVDQDIDCAKAALASIT